jgi:hypothetical protein
MKKTFIVGFALTILGIIFITIASLNNAFYDVPQINEQIHFVSPHSTTKSYRQVRSIELKTPNDVKVEAYDGKSVKVSAPTSLNQIHYQSGSRRLTIGTAGVNHLLTSLLNRYDHSDPILIKIPRQTTLRLVKGSSTGELNFSALNVDQLRLRGTDEVHLNNVKVNGLLSISGEADLNLNNVTADNLNINNDGEVDIQNSDFQKQPASIANADDISITNTKLNRANLTSSDGDINLNELQITHELTVRTSDGDIHAVLNSAKNLAVSATANDGKTTIFGHSRRHFTDGNLATNYSFSTNDGDIHIE